MNYPKKYRETCADFIIEYFTCRRNQLSENFGIDLPLNIQLPILESPLETHLGQQIVKISQAAAGQLPTTAAEREAVADAVERLIESLSTPPVVPPLESFSGPFGQMVIDAALWADGDCLFTLTEAAEVLDMLPKEVGQRVRRGQLTLYFDPEEKNVRKNQRVSRLEVEALAADLSDKAKRRCVSPNQLMKEYNAGATFAALAAKYALAALTVKRRMDQATIERCAKRNTA